MGREVRRVPADWEHPREMSCDPRTTERHYKPLLGGSYERDLSSWLEGRTRWSEGFVTDYRGGWKPISPEDRGLAWETWEGDAPQFSDYMPAWPESERTHWQMYEDTSEGTPISPVMPSPESLAHWLAGNGASSFADMTATYEQWLAAIQQGWAPSATISGGKLKSGVAHAAESK